MKQGDIFFLPLGFFVVLWLGCTTESMQEYTGWQTYHGHTSGIKYSALAQVDTQNVHLLEPAWIYHTGDADTIHHSQIQCNPIIVNGVLYGVSAKMMLFALDAASGKEIWKFDPTDMPDSNVLSKDMYHVMINSRGITYWSDGKGDERIFFNAGSYTWAIDASTGKPIPSFGEGGAINLHTSLGRQVDDLFIVNTSPGIVYGDLLILGSRVDEQLPSAPGHIRAYDVRTGKQQWIFHTIPQPGEFGYDTWEDGNAWTYWGGANVWSGFTLDEKRGILFAPTGSAASDFYGGRRKGSNLFANCLLALDAATGKRIWHQQIIHHDLWDYDLSSPPVLATVKRDNKVIDAVALTTKTGYVYVFERATGNPLFDIVETPVDTVGATPGEAVWPTQPIPVLPKPFARNTLDISEINPFLPESERKALAAQLQQYRYGKPFIPPGFQPSILMPGFDGGGEWGGPAYDPQTGLLYVNANQMAWIMQMRQNPLPPEKNETMALAGMRLYGQHCLACHGADRKGTGNNPSLIGLEKTGNADTLHALIKNGRRMMPAFQHLSPLEIEAITTYIMQHKEAGQKQIRIKRTYQDSLNHMPYSIVGYKKFLASNGYPAIAPPWGTLTAIDLNSGAHMWNIPLGNYDELNPDGKIPTGTENYGGPVVTAGGLLFIGASRDGKFRAFHKGTGKLLLEYKLPVPAFATPSIYQMNGKQYIVIACGGGKLGTKSGDSYMAFTLP